MNIKDFLLDNYIYIIIVIILIIITIIGFLADKKKNGAKKLEKAPIASNNAGYTPGGTAPITYDPAAMNNTMVNNGLNVNQMNLPTTPTNNQVQNNMAQPMPAPEVLNQPQPVTAVPVSPVNNVNMTQPGMVAEPMPNVVMNQPGPVEPMANVNMTQPGMAAELMSNVNQPGPVEPMNNNMVFVPEPMYQPLSDQQPHFEGVTPSEPAPVQQPMMNQPGPVQPNGFEQMNNINPAPMEAPVMAPTPNPIPNPMPENVNNVNMMNNGMMANQPVMPNPMPIPNPVDNTVPNPITPPQPVNPTPVGFVFGPQQNNNQNM